MNVKEIKCPHCKQWTLWAGNHYDRCLYCNAFLEPDRFTGEVEQKIRNVVRTEDDPLFIKPTDTGRMRKLKNALRFFRTWATYLQVAFFGFISLLLFLLGLCAV